jgi:hypothetical protein
MCACGTNGTSAPPSTHKAEGPGSASSSTTSSTTTASSGTSTTTSYPVTGPSLTEIETSKTVTVGGKTVTVPRDTAKHAITPQVGDGQQIIVSVAGFLPARLYSTPSEPIVWTNLTDQPQKVIFDYFSVSSPEIPPGGTWSWTTQDSESIAYRSALGMRAVVTVNPPGV